MSSREEPVVFNETCNEALEQRISIAAHSSISGAEEETSLNGVVELLIYSMHMTNFMHL